MTVIPAKAGIKKRRSSQKKIYICDLRKKPKIKRETHKIMGVPYVVCFPILLKLHDYIVIPAF
jgi:hypothetical protein